MQVDFVLLVSRQGKVRLAKWYAPKTAKERSKLVREVTNMVLSRQQKLCNFLEYKDSKVVYKRCVFLSFRTPDPLSSHPALTTLTAGTPRSSSSWGVIRKTTNC